MSLFINDLFHTVQGEGFHAGRRALFVRMPYCNLKCSWCDTKFDTYQKLTDGDLISFAEKEMTRFAVITGGEPLMHGHTPKVVELLRGQGFEVACETNGTFAPKCEFDWITCSPKRDANYVVHNDLWNRVDEFKYVVDDNFNFSLLDRHQGRRARLSLSPEFGSMQQNVEKILNYIALNPTWRLNLQTHKWIGVP